MYYPRILIKIFFFFDKLCWFIFRPRTYGVKCVVNSGSEILLIKNNYGMASWTFPGGKIKRGEIAEDAVKREVMEETGILVKNVRQIGQFESTREYKRDNITVFAGEAVNKELNIDHGEILEAKWFFLDNLPEMSEIARKILDMRR
jgi:mutator protein MutT